VDGAILGDTVKGGSGCQTLPGLPSAAWLFGLVPLVVGYGRRRS
jgi:hypothetical protein